ncbi:MAG: VOC family protein [Pseudomonadota bacterium]|nr:VOC family protein [Pseudomonadota bacterium]
MTIQPYLFFNGRCEEAIEFYGRALDAKVEMLSRFSDSPEPMAPGMLPAGSEHKVMHVSLRIGDSVIMASDGMCNGEARFDGFSLSITCRDSTEADRIFTALVQHGGQVRMPMARTFWSPRFGMVTDRYGVGWMINAAA